MSQWVFSSYIQLSNVLLDPIHNVLKRCFPDTASSVFMSFVTLPIGDEKLRLSLTGIFNLLLEIKNGVVSHRAICVCG